MDRKVLAGILKRSYKSIDRENFKDRLKLQKYIYLIQNRGIPLGFYFNFYLYGPYSTDLTRASFQIEDYENAHPVKFKNEQYEKIFVDTLSVIDKHKNDTKWLECTSSILFLKDIGYTKASIYRKLKNKITSFDESYINQVWKELIDIGWLNE